MRELFFRALELARCIPAISEAASAKRILVPTSADPVRPRLKHAVDSPNPARSQFGEYSFSITAMLVQKFNDFLATEPTNLADEVDLVTGNSFTRQPG